MENRRSIVVDNYHGVFVADEFRFLEDPKSPVTKAWTEEQNEEARRYLDGIPVRDTIRTRLEELWNYTMYGRHIRVANRLFYLEKQGLQNQPSLYVEEEDKSVRLLVDVNALSEDGTVALTGFSVRKDGKKLAYLVSARGSDWQVLRVLDVESGKNDEDVIQWCKFTNAAWHPNLSGFYYTRFPEQDESGVVDQTQNAKVYYHELGTSQASDTLVYERPDAPELQFHPFVSEDGQYLFLHVTKGTDRETRLYVRGIESDGEFHRILDEGDALYQFVGNTGQDLFILTDENASNRRIVKISIENPAKSAWQEIIAETKDAVEFATIAGGELLLGYIQDAQTRLRLAHLDGTEMRDVTMPTMGSITSLDADYEDESVLFGLTSFLFPNQIYELNVQTGEVSPIRTVSSSFAADEYETTQVFSPSKDGTKVPMFLTHKRGMVKDGKNPVILTGYGGFNLSVTPQFSPSTLYWLEQGGIFAQANLRGGSEYGETWHRAGMLENKQNVFDDFHSAAEWLIENGYSSSSRIATRGGSNGGLLVAATMLQRPELYGAVICQVPVIDMLRYHRFTVGRYWVGEYGNAEENAEHFRFMYAYSPLHNVVQGRVYPPILITTADTDDRVVPSHAKKFFATLKAASPDANPILLRVETGAGHGAGKPTSKVIDEQADIYAFLAKTFGE